MSYDKILIALSGEEDEIKVIREAFRLAEGLSATPAFLTVNNPRAGKPHMMMDTIEPVREEDIRNLIASAGFEDKSKGVDVNIVEDDTYEEEIAKWTKNIDLLVMGRDQKNKFLEALITSLDEKVANIVDCPILIVPKN